MAAMLESKDRSMLVDGEEEARPMGVGHWLKPLYYSAQSVVDARCQLHH